MQLSIEELTKKNELQNARVKFIFKIFASVVVFMGIDRFLYSFLNQATDLTEHQTIALIGSYIFALLVYINIFFWLIALIKDFKKNNIEDKLYFFKRCLFYHYSLISLSLVISFSVAFWIL